VLKGKREKWGLSDRVLNEKEKEAEMPVKDIYWHQLAISLSMFCRKGGTLQTGEGEESWE